MGDDESLGLLGNGRLLLVVVRDRVSVFVGDLPGDGAADGTFFLPVVIHGVHFVRSGSDVTHMIDLWLR